MNYAFKLNFIIQECILFSFELNDLLINEINFFMDVKH